MDMLKKKAAAAALTAGLLGGGAAGMILGGTSVIGAEESTTSTTVAADPSDRPDPSGRLADAIAPLVDDGTITQAQADAVIAALRDVAPRGGRGGRGGGPRGHDGPGRGVRLGMEAAAEALGMSTEDLRTALRDGRTMAEVAEAQGVEVQTVIDALIAEVDEHLDERVADGDLTQDEADERLAAATERITDRVDNGGPRHEGGPLRGGRHHDAAAPDDSGD